ncbi:MAG: hypothetical protein M3Q40_01675 [Pseudomonadota bacterium]|nr:hypothetical protein [Pseudomonadota bacterium]
MKTFLSSLLVVLAIAGCNRERTAVAGEDISITTHSAIVPGGEPGEGVATTPVTMPPPAEAAARCVAFTGHERDECMAAAQKVTGLEYDLEHGPAAQPGVTEPQAPVEAAGEGR